MKGLGYKECEFLVLEIQSELCSVGGANPHFVSNSFGVVRIWGQLALVPQTLDSLTPPDPQVLFDTPLVK